MGWSAGRSAADGGGSPPAPNHPPVLPAPGTGGAEPVGLCSDAPDCDDANACTTDDCVAGICFHEPIPGCVPCTDGQPCPPVDLVFVMDTSGSMKDEAAALCASIDGVVDALSAGGITVHVTILGVASSPGGAFLCVEGDVVDQFGGTVPGNPGACVFPGGPFPEESWGPGSAIVAAEFPWTPNSIRVVSPIADESPCNGSFPGGCEVPGADEDAAINLIAVAQQHNVTVSPILGGGADACAAQLAFDVASATGGMVFQSTTPSSDIALAILQLVGQACVAVGECSDHNACTTNDACVDGVCAGTPIPGCTSCVLDSDCEDDFYCTQDRCFDGRCFNTNLNDVACVTDDDCNGANCNTTTGFCECTQPASLCLVNVPGSLPNEGCFAPDDIVRVDVVIGATLDVLAGGQFYIDYDPQVLRFLRIDPGSFVDDTSVFTNEIFEAVDEVGGRIFYAVGIEVFGVGATGPAIMATIQFEALSACQDDVLCFLNENPRNTRLSDVLGNSVPYEPCCTGTIRIDGGPPVLLNCPDSVVAGADPGGVTAEVHWAPVIAADACEGQISRVCEGTHSDGLPIDHLIETGGEFPPGVSTFECAAIDDCGLVGTCSWTVEVVTSNLLDVEVQLSPTIVPGPLSRCVTFELVSSCAEPPTVVQAMLDFGAPYNLPGRARKFGIPIPAGDYQCITARDTRHTLRSRSSVGFANGRFSAQFMGDPTFGGNWLAGGNLDDNAAIDAIDFGHYMVDYLSLVSPGTGCGDSGTHADINGDGLVDQIDGTFILTNFGTTDADGCCQGGPASASGPRLDVSIRELRAMGLGDLAAGDLNHDGRINRADLDAFAAGALPIRLDSRPKPTMRLERGHAGH